MNQRLKQLQIDIAKTREGASSISVLHFLHFFHNFTLFQNFTFFHNFTRFSEVFAFFSQFFIFFHNFFTILHFLHIFHIFSLESDWWALISELLINEKSDWNTQFDTMSEEFKLTNKLVEDYVSINPCGESNQIIVNLEIS